MRQIFNETLVRVRQKLGRVTARACERHEKLFGLLYHDFARRPANVARTLQKFDTDTEAEISRVVREVRERGVSFWPGLFSDENFLEEANKLVTILETEAKEAIANSDTGIGIYNGERDCYYWPNTPYRIRTFFVNNDQSSNRPPSIDNVMNHAILCEIDFRLRSTHSTFGILAESLIPGEKNMDWHIDVLGDQLKAMVLLTDVETRHGPMEYKLGSHLLRLPRHWKPDQQRGVSFTQEEVDEMPGESIKAVGKAGDCVIFDSHGVHRGTRCVDGRRHNIVSYFQGGQTRRNSLVRFLAGK